MSVNAQKKFSPVRHVEPAPTPLRTLRKAKGLSIEQLAVAAGLSGTTVRRAEQDARTISKRTGVLLATVLGVEPELLRGEVEDPADTGGAGTAP